MSCHPRCSRYCWLLWFIERGTTVSKKQIVRTSMYCVNCLQNLLLLRRGGPHCADAVGDVADWHRLWHWFVVLGRHLLAKQSLCCEKYRYVFEGTVLFPLNLCSFTNRIYRYLRLSTHFTAAAISSTWCCSFVRYTYTCNCIRWKHRLRKWREKWSWGFSE